jgi:hypothetical protein
LEERHESLKRKTDVNLEEIWATLLDTRPEKMSRMSKSGEDSVRSYVIKLLNLVEHLTLSLSTQSKGIV